LRMPLSMSPTSPASWRFLWFPGCNRVRGEKRLSRLGLHFYFGVNRAFACSES
jgi:hypothetical protein